MLTGKEMAKYLLEEKGFSNFEIRQTNSRTTGSRCIYSPNDKTIIYLYKEDYYSSAIVNMFVGAHEASHVLVYHTNYSHYKKVKGSERMFRLLLISTVIIYPLAAIFPQIMLYFLLALISSIFLVYAKVYGNILQIDEEKADNLALQFINTNLKKVINNSVSDETFEDIKGSVKDCYESRSKIIKDKCTFIIMVAVCGGIAPAIALFIITYFVIRSFT